MLRGLSGNVVFCPVHSLDQKCLHSFADIGVVHLEQTVLKTTAARSINFIANLVHSVGECLKSSWIWGTLSTKESLLWEALGDLLGNVSIRFVQEFLNQLVGWCGIEDVLFNRNILIVELVDESERGDAFSIRAETELSELVGDG